MDTIKSKLGLSDDNFLDFENKFYNYPSLYLCNTCKGYIIKHRVPKLATSNGLKFVEIPECLKKLSPLEERVCAPIIPFMHIKPLKSYLVNGQLGLRGSVVNIPIEVNDCLTFLPRSFGDMSTIQVQLKRHFDHIILYV